MKCAINLIGFERFDTGTLYTILGKSIFVSLDDEICYGHKHLLDLNTTGISLF
jgi:hypothetical protein